MEEGDDLRLQNEILSTPKPKWEQLSSRRTINYGGVLGKKKLIAVDDFPPELKELMKKTSQYTTEERNHALINEYLSGQGIMPHTDGPAFLPLIMTASIGSNVLLDFYKPINPEEGESSLSSRFAGSLLVEPRSLVIITDYAYSSLLHGIAERAEDVLSEEVFNCPPERVGEVVKRHTRYSITMRRVGAVSSAAISALLGRGTHNRKQ